MATKREYGKQSGQRFVPSTLEVRSTLAYAKEAATWGGRQWMGVSQVDRHSSSSCHNPLCKKWYPAMTGFEYAGAFYCSTECAIVGGPGSHQETE